MRLSSISMSKYVEKNMILDLSSFKTQHVFSVKPTHKPMVHGVRPLRFVQFSKYTYSDMSHARNKTLPKTTGTAAEGDGGNFKNRTL